MNNWIVDLNQKEQARGTALVFVPHAGGGPNAFRSVAREIRRKLPVYAICYPGHENRISEPLVDDFSFVVTIAALLLHRSTLHCYSAPWQTATP